MPPSCTAYVPAGNGRSGGTHGMGGAWGGSGSQAAPAGGPWPNPLLARPGNAALGAAPGTNACVEGVVVDSPRAVVVLAPAPLSPSSPELPQPTRVTATATTRG